MTRRLPWKHTATSRTSKAKGKSKVDESNSQSSESSQPHGPSQKRKHSDGEESDRQDDENWRMTESDLSATAKLWTRDLHQQAYDNLFRVQQKETERSKRLTDLLDQPVVQQILPPLPPRIPEVKPQHKVVLQAPAVISTRSIHHDLSSKIVPSSRPVSRDAHNNKNLINGKEPNPIISMQPAAQSSTRPAAPILSEAALARRRKREQRRQIDATVVPLF